MMGKTDVKKIQNQRFNSMEHFGKVYKKRWSASSRKRREGRRDEQMQVEIQIHINYLYLYLYVYLYLYLYLMLYLNLYLYQIRGGVLVTSV